MSYFAIHQKLTQHCKPIILQFKKYMLLDSKDGSTNSLKVLNAT